MLRLTNLTLHWAVVLGFLCLVAVPWEELLPTRISLTDVLEGPSLAHPLGTDNLGRDLMARLSGAIKGAVLPLWLVAVATSCLGFAVGIILQANERLAAIKVLSQLLNLGSMVVISVPLGVLVLLFAVHSETMGLVPVAVSLGIVFFARSLLSLWSWYFRDAQLEYWNAHAALGGTGWERLWRYGIQGAWRWSLLQELVFHLQVAVSIEASLSYLGFGVQEPQPSVGNMLASHFDRFLNGEFWVLGCCVVVLALASMVPRSVLVLLADLRLSRPRSQGLPLQASSKIETLNGSRALHT